MSVGPSLSLQQRVGNNSSKHVFETTMIKIRTKNDGKIKKNYVKSKSTKVKQNVPLFVSGEW